VILAGPVYGDGYPQLLFNAARTPRDRGGGHPPALVEAMGAGRIVFYSTTSRTVEVAGNDAVAFRFAPRIPGGCATGACRRRLAFAPFATAARERVARRYRWDAVTTPTRRCWRSCAPRAARLIAYRRLLVDAFLTAASFLLAHQLRAHVLPRVVPALFPRGIYR